VRAFARSHAILLNSLWLDQSQLPIKLRPGADMPGNYMQSEPVEQPAYLTRDILERQPLALRSLDQANFILYAAPNVEGQALLPQLGRLLRTQRAEWSCVAGKILALCQRRYVLDSPGTRLSHRFASQYQTP
jgi:hypothetical protein